MSRSSLLLLLGLPLARFSGLSCAPSTSCSPSSGASGTSCAGLSSSALCQSVTVEPSAPPLSLPGVSSVLPVAVAVTGVGCMPPIIGIALANLPLVSHGVPCMAKIVSGL
eukprot:3011739-Amphidinium_carterae.2